MLNKDHITQLQAGTDEWRAFRLGLFTSSEIHLLMGAKGIGKSGMDYIYKKVGESITGRSDEKQYGFVEQLDYGLSNEVEALNEFSKTIKCDYLVVQKTIHDPNTLFASTPDALIVWADKDSEDYISHTLELKCPFKFSNYIQQRLCKTPADLKAIFPEYYWQVLDQMLVCGATIGHFYTYNPNFPEGNRGHAIEFHKVPLYDDFRLLIERKRQAEEIFDNIKRELS